jgi:hypothetical protein
VVGISTVTSGATAIMQSESDMYRNRNLKDSGYDRLVEKLREIEEDADRDMVCKKINALRTAYSLHILIVPCMDTVSCCTTRCCANLFDQV